jgi:hypothetical protein
LLPRKEGRIEMRKIVLAILGLMLFANCATAISTKGTRIDENAVKQIQIGKTTRSDILKMFGAPGGIIDTGTGAALKSRTTGDINLATKQEVAVGKNQEIFTYEYSERKAYTALHTTEKKNTLMIWIDKDTGIVQDYGYRKEIK